jgi:hypothetical protein
LCALLWIASSAFGLLAMTGRLRRAPQMTAEGR